jgi:hypothetical protein
VIELQDESVVDEIHVHWRDYRFAMPREHFRQIADVFATAKLELDDFESKHDYRRSPHRDRSMDDFETEAKKYAGHQARIMGEVQLPLTAIRSRFDPGETDSGVAASWSPDRSSMAAVTAAYTVGERVAPLVLSTESDGRHLVIDGNHRLAAARALGLRDINCIVTDLTWQQTVDFRRAEGLLKKFDSDTGHRFNTSGFNRQYFAYRASRYYADHFHRHLWQHRLLARSRTARALASAVRYLRRTLRQLVKI